MNLHMRIFASLAFVFASGSMVANPVETTQATVELISESEQVAPGESFDVAVHFELAPHWHIYWQNPGSSGLPLELSWELPNGVTVGEVQWPVPERFDLDGYITYGYEDGVTFIVPMQVDESFIGAAIDLKVDAFWLICKELCLPGEAVLELQLPIDEESEIGSHANLFGQARAQLPQQEAPWGLSASVDTESGSAVISLNGDALPETLYFYAAAEGVIDPNEPQLLSTIGAGRAELRLALDQIFTEAPSDALVGVLQSGSGAWQIDIKLGDTVEASTGLSESQAGGFEQWLLSLGLPGFLSLAFLGGLILNVMPCVLPVLSLKVFSLLKHSGQSKQQALAHGIAYTVGVVLSFFLLAGALLALRALGERVGWGFQLQNPSFVVVLVVVFFLFGLNLMGVFEIGARLVGADAKVAQRKDVLGSFGMGVLAAVVGAPCMGPLVASVSGIAVQADAATGLLIFGMMGFGLASPFLLLSIFPKLVAYLPKPGVWMESFKQFMGFLLMAAVVFLAWVVGSQGGVDAIFAILIVLLITALAAWIYGRWAAPVKSAKSKWIASLLSLVLVVAVSVHGISSTELAYESFSGNSTSLDGQWQPWSSERVEEELAAGNSVFIDFTATWCLICQVNKKVALRTDETTALFEKYRITALSADWTRYDAAITDELERFGRSGVPLYVLYAPDGEVTVLPQGLTNGIVREAVENALK
ncbi:MAG: protein-disulfide reductase DsbD family protein [Lentimonas sp.]